MKVITFLVVFLIIGNACVWAQINSYDISKYVRPDFKFRSWTANPSFGNNYRDIKADYSSLGIDKSKEGNHGLTLGVSSIYRTTVNSLTQQTNVRFSISSSYNWDELLGSNNTSLENTNSEFRSNLQFTYNKRHFFKPKRFIEINNTLNGRFDNSINYNTNLSNIETRTRGYEQRVSDYLELSYGIGRIENINDAWHTITILKTLQYANVLEKELSDEEITQLANLITTIKNKRFKDIRHFLINEYEELVDYFIQNEIVDENNYKFYAVLQDAWRFELFENRLQGHTFNFGVLGGFSRQRQTNFQLFDNSINYGIFGKYVNRKAINQWLQFDQIYRLNLGKDDYQGRDFFFYKNDFFVEPELQLELSFLFNARNHLISYATGTSKLQNFELDHSISAINTGINYRHYFSPTLRLNILANLRYSYFKNNEVIVSQANNRSVSVRFEYFIL